MAVFNELISLELSGVSQVWHVTGSLEVARSQNSQQLQH